MMAQCGLTGCSRPVYIDPYTNEVFDFCGRTHAKESKRILSSTSSLSPPSINSSFNEVCLLSGCNRKVYKNASGEIFDYCGKSHALLARRQNSIKKSSSKSLGNGEDVIVIDDDELEADINTAIALSLAEQNHSNKNLRQSKHIFYDPSSTKQKRHIDSTWTCFLCTYINEAKDYNCGACDTDKCLKESAADVIRKQKEEAEELFDELSNRKMEIFWEEVETAKELHESIWKCITCNTVNKCDVPSCVQCLEPKIKPEGSETWPCRRCTFDNCVGDSLCIMCGDTIPTGFKVKPFGKSDCGIPGCNLSATYYGFCSKIHFDLAVTKHIIPPAEDGIEVVFVGDTGDYAAHLLRAKHPKYMSVKAQFLASWLKIESGNPRVERIYWIHSKPSVRESFDKMKDEIGNIVRRFHGTTQSEDCMFGTIQSKRPCNTVECKVCSICRRGFDLSFVTKGPGGAAWNNNLRYGPGLYFSPVSSKSNDYNGGSERLRPAQSGTKRKWRSMFLCSVVVGNAFTTTEGFLPPQQCPPPGFNSVVGETGAALNYAEVAVYKAEQAIPSYLIVYSLDN